MLRFLKIIFKNFYRFISFLQTRNTKIFNANINNFCKFNRYTVVGNNVHFNGCKIYGNGKVYIGDNFHSAKNLKILTTFHNYNGNKIPYDETFITKDVKIDDNVWIGIDVIILGGVTIGEGAIIQAGSVVSKSIPPLSIAGGNPARVFSQRDENKYYLLKHNKNVVLVYENRSYCWS